ncbi:MAG: TIGR03668 family PPOX class F420-dependent oxidoreductase [Acetobacteraceae bacterium]|nr:TIGR03668 family PPOX class F420-dependent oxidoreductase [Acetobacteraceae bacterium]
MLSAAARAFLLSRRVAHLATADGAGVPHVVPVCFALAGDSAYVTVDEKPKSGRRLRRLANLAVNPACCLVADRYDEDWARLGWVMLHGRAEILADGDEHDAAQALLRARYVQYRAMALGALPVIALRIARATSWGDLAPEP